MAWEQGLFDDMGTMVSWTVQDEPRPTYLGWLVVAWLGFKLWNLGAYNAANGRVGEVIGTG